MTIFHKLQDSIHELLSSGYLSSIDFENELVEGITAEKYIENVKTLIYAEDLCILPLAKKFLEEEDPDLSLSLEIAGEEGYSLKELSAIKLANILNHHKMNEELDSVQDEIEEAFEDYFEDKLISEL